MDPPNPNNEGDDFFSDTVDDCTTAKDPSESSGSASTLCDPEPVSDEFLRSHPQELPGAASPATTIRRRRNRRRSLVKEATDLGSESDLISGMRTNVRQQQDDRCDRNLKENENASETRDSMQVEDRAFSAPSGLREEDNEESIITTAANNDTAGDTADSAELGISSSNFLESIAGLVIKAIGLQIHLFVMFTTYPLLFLYHSCMFFIDPFRTIRRGKNFLIGTLSRVLDVVCGYIGVPVHRLFGDHKSIWKLALRYGCGLLWSIYVCFILFSLLVSSLGISGFMMKYLIEKPLHKRGILNFDYSKQSPVAYVPIISCADIFRGEDSENKVGARIIPSKQKVVVTVSLLVPESEYNRNLGMFQVRVDFLSRNGKILASSSQPSMLKFRSEPIRLVLTFLKMAPLITGYISETQTLNVKMRGFVAQDGPTSCLKVTLEQRAEFGPGAGIPEIYDASLVLESELPFLNRILWNWKMSIFVWTTMMVFTMELLLVLLCCRPIIFPRTRRRDGSSHSTATQN